MDYEDYLSVSYRPLKTIEVLSDIIYIKSNEDWNIFSQMTRENGEELLSINYAIKLCAKDLLNQRLEEINNIKYDL
jgi:hypothetical protein